MSDFNKQESSKSKPKEAMVCRFGRTSEKVEKAEAGLYNLSAMMHGLKSPATYIRALKCLEYRFASIEQVETLIASRWL
eukprot:7569802-Ditylum_brightwellii.AAC.1